MAMVDNELNPLQRLITAYAQRDDRPRYALLFAFDTRLAEIIRSATEILIAQMKLTWWRDILTMDAAQRPKGEPLVQALNQAEAEGADLSVLVALVDGWEYLLQEFPWDDRQFENYARARGEGFFSFGLGAGHQLTAAQKQQAQRWAYWDFARHCSDHDVRRQSFEKCIAAQAAGGPISFNRSGRPLSILCKLVERDARQAELTVDLLRPGTAGMIIWHGLTGR